MGQGDSQIWVKGELYESQYFDLDKGSYVLKATGQFKDYNFSNPIDYKNFTCFTFKDKKIHLIKVLI